MFYIKAKSFGDFVLKGYNIIVKGKKGDVSKEGR